MTLRTEWAVTAGSDHVVHQRFPGLGRTICGYPARGTLTKPGTRRQCKQCEQYLARLR